MSATPPPLHDAPLFARCPACGRGLRAQVDLTQDRPRSVAACPWCRRRIVVHGPA